MERISVPTSLSLSYHPPPPPLPPFYPLYAAPNCTKAKAVFAALVYPLVFCK